MAATAVISADRRYVRISVVPLFSSIGDVTTFNFATGSQATTSGSSGGGVGGGPGGGGSCLGPVGYISIVESTVCSLALRAHGILHTHGRLKARLKAMASAPDLATPLATRTAGAAG